MGTPVSAEESLELLLGRGDPALVALFIGHLVERFPGLDLPDEEDPRFGGIGGLEMPVGGIRLEDFAMLAGGDAQAVRNFGGDGEDGEEFVLPAEKVAGEEGEVIDCRATIGTGGEGIDEAFLNGRVAAGIELDLAVHQRQRRDDEALGLEVAKPALVLGDGEFAGIGGHGVEAEMLRN